MFLKLLKLKILLKKCKKRTKKMIELINRIEVPN